MNAMSVDRSAPRRLISVADAAEYLGCSTKSIRRRIAEGAIPAYRAPGGGRLMRVDLNDLEAMLTPVNPGEVTP